MPSDPIYLDNHATTRCDPRVVEAMLPWFSEAYGNAGSRHAYGEAARDAVDRSRQTIASAIDAEPAEIVFTSGATESNNLAIRGVAERPRRRGDHLVSVTTEHLAVLDPIARLVKRGHKSTLLGVEPTGSPRAGWLDPQRVADAITDETCLVSVMLANNEIGVVHPIAEIGTICRERGVLLHCDATQAVGKLPVSVRELGVDLMSLTGHKLHGPKGVGALYVRGRDPIVRLEPLVTGGGQEGGRRSGTLNTPGLVGLAESVRLACEEQPAEAKRLAALRDRLFDRLLGGVVGIDFVGPDWRVEPDLRLPNNLTLRFDRLDGEALMLRLPGLALSSGAACSSSDAKPSHVLRGVGLSDDHARCTLRIGLGRDNTEADVDAAAEQIGAASEGLRAEMRG
ncbi:Cysteine desulfurase [Planctomycetes bacterium MalM25]|nr:Cysteine desulfurase [Planctomycetes bacterium MalM25]